MEKLLTSLFQTSKERLSLGIQGTYPELLTETLKNKSEVKHAINEKLTRPWIKHFFITQFLRESNAEEDIIARDNNLIELFKTTIPLSENSFIESALSSWRMFIESSFRDAETSWYNGSRKLLNKERFYSSIEQLELEIPQSNTQRAFQFYDHTRTMRKFPRIPIKLLFALPGNERETLLQIIRLAVRENPHNNDVALLAYSFMRAWDRTTEFLDLVRIEHNTELEEWYYWVEGDMKQVGEIKRAAGDYTSTFHIFERAMLNITDCKDIADWFLKENEFKSAYHFYYKAKEFETALDLIQNISMKEFAELTNLRRAAQCERPLDFHNDGNRITTLYQEEVETLRGFSRIRAAETYKQVAAKARQQFDRETIEMKYAFGELSEDEYQRLVRQLAERKQ